MLRIRLGLCLLILGSAPLAIAGCSVNKSNAGASAPTAGKVTSVDDSESPVPEQPAVSSTSASGAVDGVPLETLDQAETAYAQAQRDLDTLLGASGDRLAVEGSSDDDKPPKPAPEPPRAGASQLSKKDARCERVCLALASLERARDAICRITSDADERCTKATTSVEKNRERAKVCSCPAPEAEEDAAP